MDCINFPSTALLSLLPFPTLSGSGAHSSQTMKESCAAEGLGPGRCPSHLWPPTGSFHVHSLGVLNCKHFVWERPLFCWVTQRLAYWLASWFWMLSWSKFRMTGPGCSQGPQNGDEMRFQPGINNERKPQLCFKVLVLIGGWLIPPMTGNLISILTWYLTPIKQRLKAKVNGETQHVCEHSRFLCPRLLE